MQGSKRLSACILIMVFIIAQLPLVVLGSGFTEDICEIIAFTPLPEKTAYQMVPPGASLEDLNLPDTLCAMVRMTRSDTAHQDGLWQTAETENPATATSPDSIDFMLQPGQSGGPESEIMEIPVPVKWVPSQAFEGNRAGTYIFTAVIEGFRVNAEPPVITVTVGTATGTVTAFEELTDGIRWQKSSSPILPGFLNGTVDGTAVLIPVIWEADHEYDPDSPESGLYVFTARVIGDYTVAQGVETPRITVYIPSVQRRMLLMAGSATRNDPLVITTAAQLVEIAELVNAGRLESFLFNDHEAIAYLQLGSNLSLSDYSTYRNKGRGWIPIGTEDHPFRGHFNGNGKTITDLYIHDSSLGYAGLFGVVEGGVVENLGLEGVSINANFSVGAIAGNVSTNSIVQSCYVIGSVRGVVNVGGLAGEVCAEGTVQDCYAAADVSGTTCTGGVAGYVAGTVQSCYATGSVSATAFAGGIAGFLAGTGKIRDCAALNKLVGGTYSVGRVAGRNSGGSQ